MTPVDAVERAAADYTSRYGVAPEIVVRAPGRVNLIGEHTDYNGGFVFPMALPFATAIAAGPAAGRSLEIRSEGFDDRSLDLDADPMNTRGWVRYVHGMVAELDRLGIASPGWRACVATDIPTGASLSSSAALEVATGLVVGELSGRSPDPMTLASAGRSVESRLFGLHGGPLDQLASTLPVAGTAILLDCRDLTWRRVSLPPDAVVIIMDTGTRRHLAESAYADRQSNCVEAAAALGVDSLRDATLDHIHELPELLERRARHVVTENQRTLDAAAAAEAGDPVEFGRLMVASHTSLRYDYDVSGPALDAIVACASDHTACFGARMTGGGFAGCALALVARDEADRFCVDVIASYRSPPEQALEAPVQLWPVEPSAGASVVRS